MTICLGKCERCPETAVGYTDDGEALCEDCLFEHTCEELFDDERDDE